MSKSIQKGLMYVLSGCFAILMIAQFWLGKIHPFEFGVLLSLAAILCFASLQDIKTLEISDYISIAIFSISILFGLINFLGLKSIEITHSRFFSYSFFDSFASAAICIALLISTYQLGKLFKKNASVGGGDVKLLLALSILLGSYKFLLFVGLAAGIGLWWSIRVNYGQKLFPWAPSICLACMITWALCL